jgi:hypothetical protein
MYQFYNKRKPVYRKSHFRTTETGRHSGAQNIIQGQLHQQEHIIGLKYIDKGGMLANAFTNVFVYFVKQVLGFIHPPVRYIY